jgi:hypothetical protein
MGRLRGLVVVSCLLLGACVGGGGEPGSGSCDYTDFVRFGGTLYEAATHGVGRAVERDDLGPVFGVVGANAPTRDCRDYRPRDGDAAFVAKGSPVYTVAGYRPSFRLAASHDDRLWLYEAEEAAGASSGADLLDLAGKVRYLSVNSGRVELARIKEPGQVDELVRRVLASPVGAPTARIEDRYCFVVFNLADRTAVRRVFFPENGELSPGVFTPPEFTEAVSSALQARGRTCGARTSP